MPTPIADQSAAILAAKLRAKEPFSFWRFGDGFLQAVTGHRGTTCDKEPYTPELRDALLEVWDKLTTYSHSEPDILFGDWMAASFSGPNDPSRYENQWREYFRAVPDEQLLHPEALLFMRESEALVDFWRAVKEDPRRKLYFGMRGNQRVARDLGCANFSLDMGDSRLMTARLEELPFDVLLFGAGLAGMIPVFRAWRRFPERTFIHVGSALDPLGRGKSRKQQLPADKIRRMMRGIL